MNPLVLSDVHLKSSFIRTDQNYSLSRTLPHLALRRLTILILFLSGLPVCRLLRGLRPERREPGKNPPGTGSRSPPCHITGRSTSIDAVAPGVCSLLITCRDGLKLPLCGIELNCLDLDVIMNKCVRKRPGKNPAKRYSSTSRGKWQSRGRPNPHAKAK